MKEIRPIDRTKKVNRRCINCIHWKERSKKHLNNCLDKCFYCDVGAKDLEYWNCCSHFEWDPGKVYIN